MTVEKKTLLLVAITVFAAAVVVAGGMVALRHPEDEPTRTVQAARPGAKSRSAPRSGAEAPPANSRRPDAQVARAHSGNELVDLLQRHAGVTGEGALGSRWLLETMPSRKPKRLAGRRRDAAARRHCARVAAALAPELNRYVQGVADREEKTLSRLNKVRRDLAKLAPTLATKSQQAKLEHIAGRYQRLERVQQRGISELREFAKNVKAQTKVIEARCLGQIPPEAAACLARVNWHPWGGADAAAAARNAAAIRVCLPFRTFARDLIPVGLSTDAMMAITRESVALSDEVRALIEASQRR